MSTSKWYLSFALVGALAVSACAGDAGDDMADDGMDDAPAEAVEPDPAPAAGGAPQVDASMLPEGVTQAMIDAGEQIFAQSGFCYTCHGQDGMGSNLAPDLTDSEWIHATDGDFEQIVAVVTNGVSEPVEFDTPMTPMGGAQLTEEQVRQVSAYVWALAHGS